MYTKWGVFENFRKCTQNGEFSKIFENVHKMGHFRNFLKMYTKWGIFENVHKMGNFRKCTQNGAFSKMYTKWGIFENFCMFLNERIRFIQITHIFSQQEIISKPQKFSGASRRKCTQSGENPITRESHIFGVKLKIKFSKKKNNTKIFFESLFNEFSTEKMIFAPVEFS